MIPIFIGGYGRSGSTLLGAMLGSHSECLCTPESLFKSGVIRSLKNWDNEKINIDHAVKKIQRNWRFKPWGLNLRTALSSQATSIRTYKDLIEAIVSAYGRKVGRESWSYWVDHTPANIKHTEMLLTLFPVSKLIHLVRDGRAVAASVMPLDWGPNTIDKAINVWQERVEQGIEVEKKWGSDTVLRVMYEDLVSEPSRTLKSICSFLGLEFQEKMLKGDGFIVPRYTSKQHLLVGKEVDKNRVDAWKSMLTKRQIEIAEGLAGEMLERLGYSLVRGKNFRGIKRYEKTKLMIKDKYRRKVLNRIKRVLRVYGW